VIGIFQIVFFLEVVNKNLDWALILVTGGRALALLGLNLLCLKLATVKRVGFVFLLWSIGQ
jgi:hypothetical protein